MSKKIIAGNWKQNGTLKSSIALTKNIISALSTSNCKHEFIIFPPSVYFMPIKELISKTKIKIGSQNVSAYENGAFTGEISASMLKDLKINYLTVHISSGLTALKAVKKISGSTKIIGVTTLTSLNNNDLKLIGYNKSVKSLVSHQAKLAKKAGLENAFDFPGFIPEYIRPLFCEGKGPFRWVALSGDPEDIYKTDAAVLEMFPNDTVLSNWITMAKDQVQFQGLPSRICWLGYGQRAQFGVKLNKMVSSGELSAPVVIGRDHLDCGSVASPFRETESMLDGSVYS